MHIEENRPKCAATGRGRLRADESTLIERGVASTLGAPGDRMLVHLSSSKICCVS